MHARTNKKVALADDVLDFALLVSASHESESPRITCVQLRVNLLADCLIVLQPIALARVSRHEDVRHEKNIRASLLDEKAKKLSNELLVIDPQSEHVLARVTPGIKEAADIHANHRPGAMAVERQLGTVHVWRRQGRQGKR